MDSTPQSSSKNKTPHRQRDDGASPPTRSPKHGKKKQQQQQQQRKKGHNKNSKQQSLRKLSHSLSWALRHAAPQLELTMTPDGFVPLSQILSSSHPELSGWTEEQIRQVVADNDKQRFSLKQKMVTEYDQTDSSRTIWCIRANQGHSIPGIIDPDQLLTQLSSEQLASLPIIVHGTFQAAWETIQKSGLFESDETEPHAFCSRFSWKRWCDFGHAQDV